MSEARTLREFQTEQEFHDKRKTSFFVQETDPVIQDYMDALMMEIADRVEQMMRNDQPYLAFEAAYMTIANYGYLYNPQAPGVKRLLQVTLAFLADPKI